MCPSARGSNTTTTTTIKFRGRVADTPNYSLLDCLRSPRSPCSNPSRRGNQGLCLHLDRPWRQRCSLRYRTILRPLTTTKHDQGIPGGHRRIPQGTSSPTYLGASRKALLTQSNRSKRSSRSPVSLPTTGRATSPCRASLLANRCATFNRDHHREHICNRNPVVARAAGCAKDCISSWDLVCRNKRCTFFFPLVQRWQLRVPYLAAIVNSSPTSPLRRSSAIVPFQRTVEQFRASCCSFESFHNRTRTTTYNVFYTSQQVK